MSYTKEYFAERAEPQQKDYIMCVQFLEYTMAESVLDFGVGAGKYIKILDNMKVKCAGYDPNVKEYDKMPAGKFDLVLCLDVLEHIPEAFIDETLKMIKSKAKKYAIFSICDTSLWEKYKDDTHITCKSRAWWENKLSQYFKMRIVPGHFLFNNQLYLGEIVS